ncbi:hypothetical protein VQ097_001523 [Enterobacter hormaechei]|nr:hypothetical protein [Enterobacter hormaechei]HEM7457382.1 hypothetical protein [Enterobacter hormaechei]
MSIKNLVEMIKHNGLLASMAQLEKLYRIAIENEEKLAESEARCAALAAENAGLKEALWWLYETVSSDCVSIPDEKYSSVTNAAQVLSETPATNAFLAEVRAQAVEMFADSLLCPELDDTIREFAAQLRKGVQS